jgi:elongation factor Ts
MADIDAKTVMALRKKTGAPMMDCKAALKAVGGDMEKAVDEIRKKGLQSADKKAGREAAEGMIFSYVHPPGKIGVLVEVACETDFVARNDDFQAWGQDLCHHIAFADPAGLTRDDIDEALVAKETQLLIEQARETMADKPDEVIEKAIVGRMEKFFAERALLDQGWVKEDKKSVEEVRKELVAKIGENIQIKRFVRFELGA